MIKSFPSKKQWNKWTLPSKAGYISLWLAIFSLVFFIIFRKESSISVGDIKDNIKTQVNINSPESKLVINKVRKINQEYNIEKKVMADEVHITNIILTQSEGIWDSGEIFKIEVTLSEPFIDYKFIQGFPGTKSDVYIETNESKTIIYFETSTPPLKEPIILEIKSYKDLEIKKLIVSPVNEEL